MNHIKTPGPYGVSKRCDVTQRSKVQEIGRRRRCLSQNVSMMCDCDRRCWKDRRERRWLPDEFDAIR
jgi:hypothetical protein